MRTLLIFPFVLLSVQLFAQTQTGVVKSIGTDGMQEEKTYKRGVLNGSYKSYYPDQKLHVKGQYADNLKTGRWEYYKYSDTNIPFIYKSVTYENDTLNGKFRTIEHDTIIEGNYADNLLNGAWKQYKITITQAGDTMRTMIAEGEYREGKKSGHWKLFSENGLSMEGDFFLGLMAGQWKTYSPYSSTPEVMIDTRYRKDVKDGKEIQYFEFKSIPVPCKNPNANNCFDHKKIKIYREAIYNNGKLQGPYIVKSADGKLLAKGEYIDGEKVGKWQEWSDEYKMIMFANYFDGQLAGPVTYKDINGITRINGSYNNNLKNSKWTWYDDNGKTIRETEFKDGKLNGAWVEYNPQEMKSIYKNFENDMLKKVMVYDNNGLNPVWEYTISYPQGDSPLSVEVKQVRGDTTEYTNYSFKAETPLEHAHFIEKFIAAKKEEEKCYRNGIYEKYVNDLLLFSGNYTKDVKDGVWEFELTRGVRWKKTFKMGSLVKEYYYNIHGKTPFEGDYIVNYPAGGMKYFFKIKGGFRNGKSRYYDTRGNEIKVEKYKEGVLQD